MKTLKYLFLLIIVIAVSGLAYQNLEFFAQAVSLKVNVKDFHYVIPEIPTGAYLGICFFLGLILSWMNGLSAKWALNKVVKDKESDIEALKGQVEDLKVDLNFFTSDPYIRKGLEEQAGKEEPHAAKEPPVLEEPADEGSPETEPIPETETEPIPETETEPAAEDSTDTDLEEIREEKKADTE